MQNLEGAREENEAGTAERLADANKTASAERMRLVEDNTSLRQALDKAQAEQRDAADEAAMATNRLVVVNKTSDELRARIQSLEVDRDEVWQVVLSATNTQA